VSFDALKRNYPGRPNLTPALKAFMVTPGTSCCVQISHSLNLAGQPITQTYVGQRRNDSRWGRTGILTFRDAGYGSHTELWDGRQIPACS
jgi:hypothetical protein